MNRLDSPIKPASHKEDHARDPEVLGARFFRDSEALEALVQYAAPYLFERQHGASTRIWALDCARGEDAYSLAILLLEQAAEMGAKPKIRIFATGLDIDAIKLARQARYPLGIGAYLSGERLSQFFTREDGSYCIKSKVRDLLVFAEHDVLKHPPFLQLDLISCRNLATSYERKSKKEILATFHYALNPGGYLCLGLGANLDELAEFRAIDLKNGIFQPIASQRSQPRAALPPLYEFPGRQVLPVLQVDEANYQALSAANEELASLNDELRSAVAELEASKEKLQSAADELQSTAGELQNLIEATGFGVLFLDADLCIKRFTPRLTGIFNVTAGDAGRSIADFTHRLKYNSLVEDAGAVLRGAPPIEREVQNDAGNFFLVRLTPYQTTQDKAAGVVITFADITASKKNEEVALASSAKLAAALASMPHAVFISDTEGRFIDFNEAFAWFYRFKSKEDCAKSFAEFPAFLDVFWPDGKPVPPEEWAVPRALRGETVTGAEYHLRHKDTGECWSGSYNFAPIRNGDGAIIGSVVTAQDVTAQKQRDEALRKSEGQLKMALSAGRLAIWDWDMETGQTTWNSEYYRMMGYALGEVKPGLRAWADRVHPEDRLEAEAVVGRALEQGGSYGAEFRTLWSNGTVRWIEARGFVERDASGRSIRCYGVMIDTTERKQAEEHLRASEARLNAIVTTATDAIVVIDEAGEIQSANPATQNLFGYAAHEIVGQNVKMLMPEEYATVHGAYLEAYKRTGKGNVIGIEREVQGKRKDGSVFPLDLSVAEWHGGRRYFTGIIRDNTKRKLAEDALRKFSRVIEQTASTVVITGTEGVIEYVNPRFTETTGYTAGEAIGKRPSLLKSGHTAESEYRQLWQTIKGGNVWRGEFKNRRKDGSFYWETAIISPIRDAGGRITHFAAVKDDITQRKESEEVLAAARRIEAVGQMAGSMAHDFNNVLAVIVGNLELAEARTADERARKHIHAALDAASAGASFSRRLLSLARKRTLEPELLDVNSCIAEAVKLVERVAGEHVELNLRLEPELGLTRTDRGEIDSALLNLAGNARDAMPKGGTLTIETRNVTLHPQQRCPHPQAQSGDYVLLRVTDTGTGMSEEVLRRAGEPFFTTKGAGRGTGLGLSSVASFAKQSGGFIAIESKEGKGTCVEIYLPRAAAQPSAERELPDLESAPQGNGELILVVEDDAHVREIALKRLEGLGYAVLEARSGPQAIELLSREGPVDLVFSDIVMPGGMSGYDIARWVRENQPAVKVMLTTGYNPGDGDGGEHHHGPELRILSKPYSRSQLAQAIHETLNAVCDQTGRTSPVKT